MSNMKLVVVTQFGGSEVLQVQEAPMPEPGPGQVRIRVTSIGMNRADLMARAGQYRLSSGDPPFTPGLEAGGYVDAIGPEVTTLQIGQRVIVGPDVPRKAAGGGGGTYRSHYIAPANRVYQAPANLPDEQLGALWLAYLTAWGCLIHLHQLKPGQVVAFPAASSAVALAGAQIAKRHGARTIGLTTSADKVQTIRNLSGFAYDEIVLTHDADGQMAPWHKSMKTAAGDRGVDLFFDPVASGAYLETEIRCLAQRGVIYVYGLLGKPDKVDVTPLIRKYGAIRGWVLNELMEAGTQVIDQGCRHILDGFADGAYRQTIERCFKLDDVRQAHDCMQTNRHVGKLVLIP